MEVVLLAGPTDQLVWMSWTKQLAALGSSPLRQLGGGHRATGRSAGVVVRQGQARRGQNSSIHHAMKGPAKQHQAQIPNQAMQKEDPDLPWDGSAALSDVNQVESLRANQAAQTGNHERSLPRPPSLLRRIAEEPESRLHRHPCELIRELELRLSKGSFDQLKLEAHRLGKL